VYSYIEMAENLLFSEVFIYRYCKCVIVTYELHSVKLKLVNSSTKCYLCHGNSST
jgi:hypothetical protein